MTGGFQATNRRREITAATLMESEELRALLEHHHASSFGWAMACCRRDQGEAEEVLQTVYLKVLEGKARFNGNALFKTWLFAVIRKTAQAQRRKNLLWALMTLKVTEQGTGKDVCDSPDESAYRSEIQRLFRRALERLPNRQREVLELVFYHELSIQEAAAVMTVSIGSARTHYERGKKRLRELLEASEGLYESDWRTKENPATIP